jgi:hypothetical protein
MSDTSTTDTAFDWSPLGEPRWRELGEAAGCTELQLRFGIARFQGASQTAAARLAGYEGNGDALRRAGYAAYRSTGVQNLLELAAIHAPESTAISDKEIDAKIAKLIRSSDSNVSLKAIEAFQKREATKKEVAENSRDESLEGNLAEIVAAVPESSAGAFLAMSAFRSSFGSVVNFPYLRECGPVVAKSYPAEWAQWREKSGGQWHEFLDRMAAGPLLEGDELTRAVKARAPANIRPPANSTSETTDAA